MAFPILNPAAAGARERSAADPARILKLWHLTSLDAPTVAVVWACAVAQAAQTAAAPGTVAALGLTVWAIYVVDRLLDARAALRGEANLALQERHYFHWRHRRVLTVLAAAGFAAAAAMVLPRLGARAFRPDGAVAAATLLYLGGVHGGDGAVRRLLRRAGALVPRDFVVGAIFGGGCVLPALAGGVHGTHARIGVAAAACALAALAWLNVWLIGRWEGHGVRSHGGMRAAAVLAGLDLAGAVLLAPAQPRFSALMAAVAASAGLLAWLNRCRHRMDPLTLRAAADLVLLTPLVFLAGFPLR